MRRAAALLLARAAPGAGRRGAAAAADAGGGAPPPAAAGSAPRAGPPPKFTIVGALTERTVPVRAPVYAIVELGGTQVKVSPDDVVYTDPLPGTAVRDVVRLERVLALGSATETKIGRPHLPAPAAVLAAVEEFFDDAKALHFHKRRRKNSRRLTGHRQPLTALRVLRVEGVEP
jgi:large subunit ribosomal protein L21